MILNGLGFANRSLYLVSHFFQDKPIERLIGEGILAEHLNDDVLGRALDAIYASGITETYSQIAVQVIKQLRLDCRIAHLDSTSFHTSVWYNSQELELEKGVIRITKGYSRDHRPDLNQIGLQLISEHQAGIPYRLKPLSGNDSDKDSFRETINTHINQLKQDVGLEYLIADSALYTAKTLSDLENCLWISRVPETLEMARELIAIIAPDLMEEPSFLNFRSLGCVYGGVKQRWLVIYSPEARKRVTKTVDKQFLKQTTTNLKAFQKLMKQDFACYAYAKKALIAFKKKLILTEIVDEHITKVPHYQKAGRPKPGQKPEYFTYRIEGVLAHRTQQRVLRIQQKSCFVLATNQLDTQELSDEEIVKKYKNQQKVERGFRFLKDPMFMAESKYLKSPKRVMALTMIMTICLLVYAALEYRIRQSLKTACESFPNQKGQEIDNPTARWIFQFFSGIHVLVIQQIQEIVLNLNYYHIFLLELLGEEYKKLYSGSG